MNLYQTQNERDIRVVEEILEAIGEAMRANQVDRIVGPSLRRMVMSQSYILLDKQLDVPVRRLDPKPLAYDAPTAEGLVKEFDTAINHIQSIVANQIRTKLMEIVRREVHDVYGEALANTPELPTNPPRGGGGGLRAPVSNGHDHDLVAAGSLTRVGGTSGAPSNSHAFHEPAPSAQARQDVSPRPRPVAEAEGREPDSVIHALRLLEQEAQAEEQGADAAPSTVPVVAAALAATPTLAPEEGGSEVYEGTVRLTVEPTNGMKQVLQFVDALRRRQEFRLLQLVGSRKDGVDIWLGLREPVSLQQALRGMDGVSAVTPVTTEGQGIDERVLSVHLLEQTA